MMNCITTRNSSLTMAPSATQDSVKGMQNGNNTFAGSLVPASDIIITGFETHGENTVSPAIPTNSAVKLTII